MEPPVQQIRNLNTELLELQKRLNRAQARGQSGDLQVTINGRGQVKVEIGTEYKLSDKRRQELSADLQAAIEQALNKHRQRISRESSKLLKSN